MNKLGFSEDKVGHMTLKKWNMLYRAYKNEYDIESIMQSKGLTYRELEKETTIDDVIPF